MKDLWNLKIVILVLMGSSAFGQIELTIDGSKSKVKIQPTMYGIFFEDINFAADGGLYAELVKNRSFEFPEPKMGWIQPNTSMHSLNRDSGILRVIRFSDAGGNHNFARISIHNADNYFLINEGYRGMGLKKGDSYRLSFQAGKRGSISGVKFQLLNDNDKVIAESLVALGSSEWQTYKTKLMANETAENARLRISFKGTGEVDLDMVSLFPEDTWRGRENGLRKDLVELLDSLDPGFLRFPGGCVAEGRTLEKRYQWKKTIGPVEEREILVNRWNTEFMHKFTPDYFQSFGLGYYEYFQLAEDLGAEPLPIISVGIACQFNTGEMVPMEELEPYVQDAMDLIEFANGPVYSKWGKIRKNMGHPQPFNLKFMGIGNEQWGPEYIERFDEFEKVIKKKHPEITIVSSSGPYPDGEHFDFAWKELKERNAELIDEHYYQSPQWFKENADRYDRYDRNGPKVFAGEYAAHPKADDGPRENNWEAALAEAAFMTGMERNADVVHMTAYAPLMAHIDAWQWAPDLIWFNNLESYGTANYQVQKLFSTTRGTDLVSVSNNGKPLTGQDQLYASAVKDIETGEIIVKLVNTSDTPKTVKLNFSGTKLASEGIVRTLQNDNLKAINSFDNPENIVPVEKQINLNEDEKIIEITPYSVNTLTVKIK